MEGLGFCLEHYIRTIKGGVVTVVPNIDSCGRPALVIRTLQDIYKSEDARRMRMSLNVKLEVPCFPTVDRTLHELGDGGCIDLDDDTTLKQLRDRSLSRKRKRDHGHQNTDRALAYEKPLDDQSDLDEPLIHLRVKKPKKSKAKRKFISRSVSSSTTLFVSQSKEKLVAENSLQFLAATVPVTVKVENCEVEEGGCSTTSFTNDASIGHDEEPNESQMMVQRHCTEEYTDCVTNRISHDHLDIEPMLMLAPMDGVDANLEAPELEVQDNLISHPLAIDFGKDTFEARSCKSSHLHVLDIEPILMLAPWHRVDVKLEALELEDQDDFDSLPFAIEFEEETLEARSCKSSQLDDVLAIEHVKESLEVNSCTSSQLNDQAPDFSSHSSISCITDEMPEQSSSSDVRVPDMTISLPRKQDVQIPDMAIILQHKDESLNGNVQVCEPSIDSSTSKIIDKSVTMEDTTSAKEKPPFCTLYEKKTNGLNYQSSHMKYELLRSGAKLTSPSPNVGTEADSCMKNQSFDNAETVSSPESCSHPEKLLSKRKIISPSSRERLRLAMNLEEQCNDIDQYKSKEKLFEKQTGKKTSPLKSDMPSGKVNVNNGGRVHFIHRNGIRHAIKKPHMEGNYDGVRSRAYPNLSSSRNSIQGCSESAIEFSQRQMHDMENVAVKLMKELNSMKGLVEQKLLFQAYRSGSLKNDADEVKSAINNATRVEEVARKWLTSMSRDCNRFCKIMKMTPPSPTSVDSEDTDRSGKKISFADDAGGKLCHVKYFENGGGSLTSDEIKQDGSST